MSFEQKIFIAWAAVIFFAGIAYMPGRRAFFSKFRRKDDEKSR